MARSVKVDLILEVSKYLRGAREAKTATKGVTDELVDAAKAGDSTAKASDSAADAMKRQASAAAKLDRDIDGLKGSLKDLSTAFALAGSEADKLDISKKIRAQQGELRKSLNARKLLGDAGEEGAEGFAASFIGRLGPLMARMPIGPHMATAMAAAAPAAVAVLGAAISGGIAVGVAGIGVALAAKNPEVKAAASDLSSLIGRELQFAARPFVPETLKSIAIVREGFLDLRPDLEGLFADAARYVEPLTRGLMGGVEALVPDLREVVHNAEPVVDVLGSHLTRAAEAAGTSLRLMTQDSEYTAQQLDQLLSTVESVIVVVGGLVAGVNAFGKAKDGFLEKLGPVGGAIQTALNPLGPAIGKLGEFARWLGNNTDEAEKVPPAVGAASAAMLDANTAARIAAAGTALYTEWLNKQNEAYRNSIDDAISAERATLRFAEATKTAKDAVDKKKGASVAERGALLGMIEAANTATRANEKQGVSSVVAAQRHKTQRDALIAVATKMFGSRAAAQAYIDKLLQIPKSVRTTISANNAQALGAITTVRTQLNNLNGKTVKTYIKVIQTAVGDRVTSSTGGGRSLNRWGGVYEHAQTGLLREAQIASPMGPARYAWAEPATGGEAFIPKFGDRQRSMAIWEHVGRNWLRALPTSGSRPAVNVTNQFTINAAPNQSVRAIAEEVSRIQGRQAHLYAR